MRLRWLTMASVVWISFLFVHITHGFLFLSHATCFRSMDRRPSNQQLIRSTSSDGEEGTFLLPSSEMLENSGRGERRKMKTLVVDGAPILLDALGPIVVSEEGMLGSIANWDTMTDQEQALTLRRIGKRNQERLKALRDRDDVQSASPGQANE